VLHQLTSHVDIVPTLFDLLECRTAPDQYAHGHSLLSDKRHTYVIASGWDDFAFITDSVKIVMSMETYNTQRADVRDRQYRKVGDPKRIIQKHSSDILDFCNNFRRFYK
jgi:membrane-anchored protein YejM (alkaline phosphatase superfamily)